MNQRFCTSPAKYSEKTFVMDVAAGGCVCLVDCPDHDQWAERIARALNALERTDGKPFRPTVAKESKPNA